MDIVFVLDTVNQHFPVFWTIFHAKSLHKMFSPFHFIVDMET